jgi:hypothetical protein
MVLCTPTKESPYMKSLCQLVLLILILATSCTKRASMYPEVVYDAIDPSEDFIPVIYEFADLPSERRVEISFCNKLKQPVCLDYRNWPGPSGWLLQGGPGMTLVIDGQRFALDQVSYTDYSPGGAEYAAPGETLRASISYDAFHLPEPLYSEKKQIEFSPMGYRCKRVIHSATSAG